MHVSSLRDKLERNPKSPELIVAVSGVFYKIMGPKNSWSALRNFQSKPSANRPLVGVRV
jgi:hypothetical protein